jgi:hypothetical protein
MRSFAKIGRTAAIAALVSGVSLVAHPVARAGGSGAHPGQQGTMSHQGQQANPSQQPGGAQQGAQTPAVVAGRIITAAATVQKIDKTKGTVTLKDAKGNTFDVKAGPNVDLEALHAGDRVTATYSEEIAVAINKASPPGAPAMTQTTVVRGGVAEQQATVTAHVVSVDPKSNTVVIRAPDGSTHSLKVNDPALQAQLAQIKPGEAFDVSYTQAVALSVQPRK